MPFEQAEALLPLWVQYWIMFIVVIPAMSILAFLFRKDMRKDALVIFLLVGAGIITVLMLYEQFGMVRLIGLGHVLFWTPAVIYLWKRLQSGALQTPYRQITWVLTLTLFAALVFDYVDVLRWVFGERGSMI